MKEYICDNGKILKCGYTTGSCATAGALASATYLLEGYFPKSVNILAPNSKVLTIPIEGYKVTEDGISCTVLKDGGDDIDITNGIEVVTTVKKVNEGINIDGGLGVGTVTKKGLNQPIGSKAINSTPREMIKINLEELASANGYTGGFDVIISVPKGEEIANKTFNPRLGIVGGISILGTTGIVRPMSDKAILDTIKAELNVKKSSGVEDLIITLGNYGNFFVKENMDISEEDTIQCSNFIGDTLDMANELGFKSILLVGHIGKLVKLGCGLMNTHSKYGDARMETLSICALKCGATTDILNKIMNCVTTDDAIQILKDNDIFEDAIKVLKDKISFYLSKRAGDSLKIEYILFSNIHGRL
ncbi:MAG: cobalt-precorrin-5B (C(1))-methyltransferase CbiD [Oscillospiraceae bacterium]